MFRPINGNIVLKTAHNKEEKIGGIYIPDSDGDDNKNSVGIIVALSKSLELQDIAIGDKIVFDKFKSNKIELDDEQYIIINFKDVLCILENSDKE